MSGIENDIARRRLIAAVLRLASVEATQDVSEPRAHDGDEIDYAIDRMDEAARNLVKTLDGPCPSE